MLLHGPCGGAEADARCLLGRPGIRGTQTTWSHEHRQGHMTQFPVADRGVGKATSTKEEGAT